MTIAQVNWWVLFDRQFKNPAKSGMPICCPKYFGNSDPYTLSSHQCSLDASRGEVVRVEGQIVEEEENYMERVLKNP